MSNPIELQKNLALLIPNAGVLKTSITNLSLIRADSIMNERAPVIYDPCIYVVIQGKKIAYLGEEAYVYDGLNYLVLSVALPLECQILEASKGSPYLAVKIDITTSMLNEIIQELPKHPSGGSVSERPISQQRGIFVSAVDGDISGVIGRLLSYVNNPSAAQMLAPMAIKELLFHVIQGEQGERLKAFAYRDKYNYQIAGVINFIQTNYARNLEVKELASQANMSESSFHQYFKAITNASPIQYIKSIRLHEARRKMLYDNHSASDAAYYVGYASPSQFSREYRRLFGMAPMMDIKSNVIKSRSNF